MRKSLFIALVIITGMAAATAQDTINRYDEAGRRHGLWIKKYSNGNIRYRGTFSHGKETGKFFFYSPSNPDHPSAVKDYTAGDGRVKVSFYRDDGTLESEGFFIGKKRTGTWKYYFKDGKTLLSTEEYRDGKRNGVSYTYYVNGKTAKEAHYKDGKLHGTVKMYSRDGVLLELMTYRDGIAEGPAEIYDENGNLYAKGQYSAGLKTGEWEFHIDGKVIRTTHPEWIHRKD